LLRILSSWSLKCLCQGQMMASCLSQGGDSPQYRWTLDGHTLTDSELFSRNIENSIIVLRQNTSGRLVCWVSNLVSGSFIYILPLTVFVLRHHTKDQRGRAFKSVTQRL
ncbi:hypothetical protein ATANTOWER_019543, partial [Ataeniobius toweri]|nr:hypothetical protein [Ataeniobius toweri]